MTKKLPRRENPACTYSEQALRSLDASEDPERRGTQFGGSRDNLDHGQIHAPVLGRKIVLARQTAGAHLEPVEERIDGQPFHAIVDGDETVAKARPQP